MRWDNIRWKFVRSVSGGIHERNHSLSVKIRCHKEVCSLAVRSNGVPYAAKASDLRQYDLLIVGGGIYASGLAGLSYLKKNPDIWKGKNVLVFCVGASPYEETTFKEIVRHNMKGELSSFPCFYCRGAWNIAQMNFLDRTLCKMLRNAVRKKAPEDYAPWEAALMEAGDENRDWTDKKYLEPILDKVNALLSKTF